MKKLFSLFLLISLNIFVFGAFFENIPTQLVQPNGEVLKLFITGDEFYRTVHDSEGYSIVQGADGWYYYAMYDAKRDELVPSEHIVTSSRNFELQMERGLTISHNKYIEIRRAYYEPTGCYPSGASNRSILRDLANNGVRATQQMNNIVICIGFSDTQSMTHNYTYVNGILNTNTDNSLKDYYFVMSYNKLEVISHFYPQPNGTVLRFYKDSYPRSYYQPYSASNPNGYDANDLYERAFREQTLLKNAVEWVNANDPIPTSLNLDINNDDECDLISFVIQGEVGEWNDLLWPHKWSMWYITYYDDPVYINGKLVWDYNFEMDGTENYFSSNTFCHEGFHVFGAPDLYHYSQTYRELRAVGPWDIMDYSKLAKPQSMSAYMKFKYGNWISSLPIATINKTYEVFPFYYNDGSNHEKPVIYRVPMTGTNTQYSVVEYRKKTGTNYDNFLPNEGLLIYRINDNMVGNAQFDGYSTFDEVYLYRPGSTQTNGIYTLGNLDEAPYNPTNGKTSFNHTTNPKPCQSNGAAENAQNINNILYDDVTDSYTFFYGNPENRTISVNKTELILEKELGATGTVSITSNVVWRVAIPESATSWLAVSKTKGLNNGTITFTTLSNNDGVEARIADVTITGNEKTIILTVIQKSSGDIAITLFPNPLDGGTVSGGGTYHFGDQVTLKATANPDYEFLNWTENDNVICMDAIFTFAAIENITLVANFKLLNGICDSKHTDKFTLFPNPVENLLKIVRSTSGKAQIEIYNIFGVIVKEFEINGLETFANISALSPGVYFIRLTDIHGTFTQRFVKE